MTWRTISTRPSAEEAEEAAMKSGKGSGGGGGGGALLPATVAQSAVGTLADVAGTLLEFLENAVEGTVIASGGEGEEDGPDEMAARPGEGGGSDPAVVLAVVRSLGAFLAELPDAHGARINALLPVGPGRYCPPLHPTHLKPSFLGSNDIL